jgi:hypothetical protein
MQSRDEEMERQEELAMLAGGIYGAAVFKTVMKKPFHQSILSGEAYTQELLRLDNPRVILANVRMERHEFISLCTLLREQSLLSDTLKGISVEQQLHIFLYIVSRNATNQSAQDRFQYSGETMSRHFSSILQAIEKLAGDYIKLPESNEPSDAITGNPYFKHCLGALDGSLIPAKIPAKLAGSYRCRKGFIARNVLAVCSFDSTFQYILAGWEGVANDSRVLEDALE